MSAVRGPGAALASTLQKASIPCIAAHGPGPVHAPYGRKPLYAANMGWFWRPAPSLSKVMCWEFCGTDGEGNIDQCQSLLMDQALGPLDAPCCPRGEQGTGESVSSQEDSALRAWYLS